MDFYSIISSNMESIPWIQPTCACSMQLQRDASQTNQRPGRRIGISPPTCLRRVQRLREPA
jgi:Lrp/AsnC family leucine-responsive transcriptional regulator